MKKCKMKGMLRKRLTITRKRKGMIGQRIRMIRARKRIKKKRKTVEMMWRR